MADFDWKSLQLDAWWKLLCGAGIALSVAAIAVKYPPAIFVGLGLLLFGAGEWRMHPEVSLPAHSYGLPPGIVTTRERRVSLSGMVLDVLGAVLFMIGIVKLLLA